VAVSGELIEFLKEQMAGFGPVSVRRMFGGAGLFRDGLMFALVVGDVLYLKADAASRGTFEAEGLEAFSYATSSGRNTIMSFMRAPEACLDDPDEMTGWCRLAFDAALRANAPEPGKKAKPAPNP
jgi:DNA transformation protein